MTKKTAATPLQVPVKMRLEEGEWVISTQGAPHLTERGVDVKQARIRLSRNLSEHHGGRPIELIERVELPKHLAAEVAEYDRIATQIEELQAKLMQMRIPLARKLTIEGRLLQSQAADLLRISGTWLGQQLRQASGSTSTKPETKTKGRSK